MSVNAFFLDSCIIFNKILNEDIIRTDKLIKNIYDKKINCYVNISIVNECDKKINDTFEFLINILKDSLKTEFLENFRLKSRNGNNILTYDDIPLLEQIFIDTFYIPKYHKERGYNRPFLTAIKSFENYIVKFMENELDNEKEVTINTLFDEITKELIKYEIIIRENFEDIETKFYKLTYTNEKAPQELINKLKPEIHYSDGNHLISMLIYSGKNNLNSIFITSDYGILRNKYILERTGKIIVSNPLYAVNYFKK